MTLVRSPTISGRFCRRPRPVRCPENTRDAPAASARARRLARPPSRRCARMCAGVVPQQPPTRFSQPLSTKRSSCAATICGRFAVVAVLVGQPGVRIAGDARAASSQQRAEVVGHELGPGGAVEADREQVGVRDRGASASAVWPASMVPVGLDGARDHHRDRGGRASRTPARCRAAPP